METPNTSNNTSSLQEVTSSIPPQGQQHLSVIYRRLEELETDVFKLKTEQILEETQLPSELLEQSNLLPIQPKKLRQGKGHRQLLSSEIEEAMKHSKFCAAQARWLGVCYTTYRKYAKMYGMWYPRPCEKGKRQTRDPESGKYPLSRILNGDFENELHLTDIIVKRKLLTANLFPEKCAQCGFHEKMITTGKVPLLLDHLDGNRRNFKKENLRLLCWNCTVICGRGYARGRFRLFDPDCWRADEATQ